MKRIPLSKHLFALVDDEDFWTLAEQRWSSVAAGFSGTGKPRHVAGRNNPETNGTILMHRVILDAPPDKEVDHIDGNPLNNQRANLRLCSKSDNRCNVPGRKTSKSGLKGVSWSGSLPSRPWAAEISRNHKRYRLGYFATKRRGGGCIRRGRATPSWGVRPNQTILRRR